jgi:hypothetical protein
MTGILIALTLEISVDKLYQPAKESNDPYVRVMPDQIPQEKTEPLYFFYPHSAPEQSNQQPSVQSEKEPAELCRFAFRPPGVPYAGLTARPCELMINPGYVLHYSGLSPPFLFVS